jgi:hypothetical protein
MMFLWCRGHSIRMRGYYDTSGGWKVTGYDKDFLWFHVPNNPTWWSYTYTMFVSSRVEQCTTLNYIPCKNEVLGKLSQNVRKHSLMFVKYRKTHVYHDTFGKSCRTNNLK